MNNMRNKILSLLVLLVAAVSGAWAATTIDFEDNALPQGWTHYGNPNNLYVAGINSRGNVSACAGSYSLYIDGNGYINNDYFVSPAINFQGAGSLSFAYATKDWSGDHNDLTVAYSTSPTGPWTYTSFEYQSSNDWTTATVDLSSLNGTYYIAFISYDNYGYCTAIDNISLDVPTSDIEVTTDAASEGALFTEASFTMPAFDATVEYEALRDMSVQMPVEVGDGEDGYRLRIKKNDQGQFGPADMSFDDMLALFTVTDEIEQNSLTFFGQTVDCNLSIFAVDENDQPTGDALGFENLTPGRYVVMATAADGSDYFGETGYSNIFELYQGYEVEVPAGEFVTYYKDEALTLEDDEARLYTITAVSETTATATPFDVIPANVPLLLKNNSSQTRTILLIPTEEPLAFMHYSGFVGSLDPTTIAASTDAQTNYACNGKAFVYVKDAINAANNKAWLEIPASANGARQLKIVFADATGISAVSGLPADNGDWYDLNGRKIAKPTKKGVYIKDGKKAVIK